jgi:murein DD-endopeptidase MepM/ murein hydrolase activator NlpD
MKKIFSLLLIINFLFAYQVVTKKWTSKDTFYSFLKQNSIPFSIYYSLPSKIKRLVKRIPVNTTVFLLKDNNNLKQALIPLNNKIQLQIIKQNNRFFTKIVPIIYETQKKYVEVDIKNYLSYDLFKATHLRELTSQIIHIFRDKVNFRAIPKDTKLKILYEEKIAYGKIKGAKILFAQISNEKYTYNAFLNPYDGRYYDQHARSLRGMFLPAPLKYIRISSYFGMRFHPILHKWLMHEGIDYVNKIGTPIHAVADGKIIYKGWIRGYGRAVEIKHKFGYITLYAHLHGWPKGIYVGKWVKQGQVIGYLGNTGLSTGPHLHFGVMHYGKWINPLKLKNAVKITLWGKKRKEFLSYIKKLKTENQNIALALK